VSSNNDFNVRAPVTLENGTTVWVTIGRGWRGDSRNKYKVRMTITSLPMTASGGKPFEVFLFDTRDDEKGKKFEADVNTVDGNNQHKENKNETARDQTG
jgi:hypothetical protein